MANMQKSTSPIDNLLYDFVSVLHSKAKSLETSEKYLRDAEQQNSQCCIELLNRVIKQDQQMVIELKDHLTEMLQGGSTHKQRAESQQQASATH